MITIRRFTFNELEVNGFVLFDETRECILIDPGCNSTKQFQQLQSFITGEKLQPVLIVNTHGHFDHIFGNKWAKEAYGCPLLIHEADLPLIEHADQYAGIFGFQIDRSPVPDQVIRSEGSIAFGNSALAIFHIPGHSPGSIVLHSPVDKFVICGDVLFRGGIGRTDLPGGNYDQLIQGIRMKLLALPPETVVWPGHGPSTTIGREYDTNPFLR